MKILLIALLTIAASGCQDENSPLFLPEETLVAVERDKLNLPRKDKLTLATAADIEFVDDLKPDTVKKIKQYLKPTGYKVDISAARPVGEYLLLWVAYPNVYDGGIDLIWSIEKRTCVGTFLGGYRG